MPAEMTTRSDERHGRWSRVAQLIVVCFVAAVPFVASNVAAGHGTAGDAAAVAAGSYVATDVEPPSDAETVAASEDSGLSGWAQLGILAVVAAAFLVVFGRRVVAVIDRRTVSWVDAWAKTVVIVVALIVSIVIVPAKVLELGAVQDMSRAAQDLITLGLWSGALVVALLVLWYAHRERRI